MLVWRPSFGATAATLFALFFCMALAITPITGAGPDIWFTRFAPYPTVYGAVVNSLYVGRSPIAVLRGAGGSPDTIYLASRTELNSAVVSPLELAAWVDRWAPSAGPDLATRLTANNRNEAPLARLARSAIPLAYVDPDSIPALVARRRRCTHYHDMDCGLTGPLRLSRPAFSADATLALVQAQEPLGGADVAGRFLLLERGPRGWIVAQWWMAWGEWRDPSGPLRVNKFAF